MDPVTAQILLGGAGLGMGLWGMNKAGKMSKRDKLRMKTAQRMGTHINPHEFIPSRIIKKGDYKLKKISGHNRKKYYKQIRAYKKADKQWRAARGFKGGSRGQWGNNAMGLGPIGPRALREMGIKMGKSKKGKGGYTFGGLGVNKKEIQKQKHYRRQDWGRIRRYEEGAKKGKNVKFISPFNKNQQKMMSKFPKQFQELARHHKLDITKNPLYKQERRYIRRGLKEKFRQKPEKLTKHDMASTQALANYNLEKNVFPRIVSQYMSGGQGPSSALNRALREAAQESQRELNGMDLQRREFNIGRKDVNYNQKLQHKAMKQDLLKQGLLQAQAPIENAMNIGNMSQAQAPNQPYFLQPPTLKSALMQGREPTQMAPQMMGGYQPQQVQQRQPGLFQNAMAGAIGGAGQAMGQFAMGALQNLFSQQPQQSPVQGGPGDVMARVTGRGFNIPPPPGPQNSFGSINFT